MYVRLDGSVMETRGALAKALLPMDVRLDGNVTETSEWQ